MNIGIFTDCYSPQINGVVTSTVTLKKELEKRGHTVTIITVKTPLAPKSEPGVLRIPSIPFRKWEEFRVGVFYPPQTLKKIAGLKLDIIHTQTEFVVCMMARVIAKVLDIPVVHTYHTMYEDYTHYAARTRINQRIIKELSKVGSKFYVNECAGIIAPSKKTKEALISYGVTKQIDVIPTGIELELFADHKNLTTEDREIENQKIEEIRVRLEIKDNDKILLSLGRVAQEKSIDIIIAQLRELLLSRWDIKLIIVGDGPAKESLMEMTQELGLKEKVIFAGRVPWKDTAYYYKMADCFITASITETQGLTLYEAMAAGTAVIAKSAENLEGEFEDGVNSLIFNEDSELSELVVRCLDDSVLREKLVEAGHITVNNLSSELFGKRVEELYVRILDGKQPRFLSKATIQRYKKKLHRPKILRKVRLKRSAKN